MRKAFTLIELLVIIAIMGTMLSLGVVGLNAGKASSRLRGATRDVFAVIRYARSTALVSQQPSIISYSTAHDGDEVVARIEVVTAQESQKTEDFGPVQTLSGEPLDAEAAGDGAGTNGNESAAVETDTVFTPISEDVVRGMRIKVTMGDETLEPVADEARQKPKISVFSNVDYLLGKYDEAKKSAAAEKKDETAAEVTPSAGSADENQETVRVVWETNGRVEPHRVWIYPDGSTPEKGLSIKIDRFGAAKVLAPGEDE